MSEIEKRPSRPPAAAEDDGGEWEVDFLAKRPAAAADAEEVQRLEARNVLSSYSHAADLLAEALQNATDAIDTRGARGDEGPRRVQIRFDRSQGRFSVGDTGIGMSREDLSIVLTPNVSLKSGRLARSGTGRSRGHKGVGLTFLALASNYLHIQTCDGTVRHDVVVRNGSRWIQGGGTKPVARGKRNVADDFLGSSCYTIVTVGDIDEERFDEELFDYPRAKLEWVLRTRTAVGNTKPVFGEPFGAHLPADEDIAVGLIYVDEKGGAAAERPVPYRYATPEEFLPPELVVDAADLPDKPQRELARLAGSAVRYRDEFTSGSGRHLDMYVFVMEAREMEGHLAAYRDREGWAPDPQQWQGFYVATRDMPTGIRFDPRHIQPRALERRVFGLVEEDQLALDIGRKTLVGRQPEMLQNAVRDAWRRRLSVIVPRVQGRAVDASVAVAQLSARIERAKRAADLDVDLPYLKQPQLRAGVMALFHEALARGGLLPALRTLRTGVFTDERDELIYVGDPNGDAPLYVVYGFTLADVIHDLERDESGSAAGLAVVWDLDAQAAQAEGIDVEDVAGAATGATHELVLHRLANLDRLPVIALRRVLEGADRE